MVDGELVFSHNPSESFCKAFCYDEDFLYLCGGSLAKREDRPNAFAYIYILDREKFELVKKIRYKDVAPIKGAIIIDK